MAAEGPDLTDFIGSTLAVTTLPHVVLAVHGTADPAPSEWTAFLAAVEHQLGKVSLVVHSAGGRPTALQRKELADMLQGRTVKTAVLTDSSVVRTVVRLIGWVNPTVRAFSESSLDEALGYLEVPAAERAAVGPELKRLKARLAASVGGAATA